MELSPSPPPHCHPFSRRRNASHGCHGVHFRFAHSTRVECGHRRLKVRQAPLKTSFDIKIKLTQCVSLFSTGLWKRSSLNQKSSFSDNFNLLTDLEIEMYRCPRRGKHFVNQNRDEMYRHFASCAKEQSTSRKHHLEYTTNNIFEESGSFEQNVPSAKESYLRSIIKLMWSV